MGLVGNRFEMMPKSAISKALMTILHSAKSSSGPSSLIWILYGLESLFECKPGENFSALLKRIAALLSLTGGQVDTPRKLLRNLYDLRSGFVHGGGTVIHPIGDEGFEKDAGDIIWKQIKSVDAGMALLLKCLQTLIVKRWMGLRFWSLSGVVE